jgi:CheY-like chemotaxis protein
VVDDEPAIGRALSRLLSDEHDVVAVLSGREALEVLRKDDRFDVILCDLMMPDTTGEQVHDALARDRPDLALRIVFATGGAFSGRMREFLERVPNARLEKPFDSERLLALLRRRVSG